MLAKYGHRDPLSFPTNLPFHPWIRAVLEDHRSHQFQRVQESRVVPKIRKEPHASILTYQSEEDEYGS